MTDLAFAPNATPADKINAVCAHLGLTMTATFVPFSQSRNAKPANGQDKPWKSLNWLVTIQRNGRDVLTTDYGQGIAHAPAHNAPVRTHGGPNSMMRERALRIEIEEGRKAMGSDGHFYAGKALPAPSLDAVIWSLCQDASALESSGFEDWAADMGFDTDSRSGEAAYRACLELALKLRSAIGEAGLELLRTAGEDY